MNKKTISRVNGGIAIYYGIGCFIAAAMGLIAIGAHLYQVFFEDREFSWGMLGGLLFATLLMGGLAYAILRTGYEELDS